MARRTHGHRRAERADSGRIDVGVFAPFAGRAVSGGADIVPGIREAVSASFSDGVPIIPRRTLAVCGVFCGVFHVFLCHVWTQFCLVPQRASTIGN